MTESFVPIPCLKSIAGPLKEITLHGNAIVCIHIVLQPGVIIWKVLSNRDKERKRWKAQEWTKGRSEEKNRKKHRFNIKINRFMWSDFQMLVMSWFRCLGLSQVNSDCILPKDPNENTGLTSSMWPCNKQHSKCCWQQPQKFFTPRTTQYTQATYNCSLK